MAVGLDGDRRAVEGKARTAVTSRARKVVIIGNGVIRNGCGERMQ